MTSAFVAIALALIVFLLIGGGFSLAPWVPTRKRDIVRINQLADLQPGEVLYELGCGDGRVCHGLAKLNPQVKIIGIELSPLLFLFAKLRNLFSPQKNLILKRANIFHQNFADADALYVFGMPDALQKLYTQLLKNKTKPLRIISYSFPFKTQSESLSASKKPHEITLHQYIL